MAPSILALANPFLDQTVFIREEFLRRQGLSLGSTTPARDESEVKASFEAAKIEGRVCSDTRSLGGSGTNVIKTLARLGRECAVYGNKGAGPSGEEVENRLRRLNITPFLAGGSKRSVGLANCFISENGERTMHSYPGSSLDFSVDDIRREYFRGAGYVYLEGYAAYSPGTLSKSVEYASQHGAYIAIDLASFNAVENCRQEFLSVIKKVDIVFGNIKEFRALMSSQRIEEIITQFSSKQMIIITDSKNGCWVKDADQKEAVHYPAHIVPDENIVATTGAGDFWAAGFLNGLMLEESIPVCVEMGNLAASAVIQVAEAELSEAGWEKLIQQIRAVQKV